MSITVRNWWDADRRTAVAGETMVLGDIVKIGTTAGGERFALKLGNGDAGELLSGKYGIVYKVSTDAAQVLESTANETVNGSRKVTISSGDFVVELRKGSIVEYSASDLHASLNPGATPTPGVLPATGAAVHIKDAKWCATSGVASSISSPVVGRVFEVRGTGATAKVSIELVY